MLFQAASRLALHAALALGPVVTNPAAGLATGLMEPPAWVMTDNGANLQKLSDQNSKLPDKAAQRVFDAGLEFASRGADEETQQLNKDALARAENRFTLLIDELAPNYYGGRAAAAKQ